ncbi:hypothetical protein FM105_05175 [Brevibacterium yomogidense]|uniref:Uncharacterized protein n=1 Tax=Brevibacterium yomogidense TaxID=946573 RepID=A0A1X6X9Q6_9MICO|nr:hypothetical protein FM105_05175 [Brevibacterium yomogidense]
MLSSIVGCDDPSVDAQRCAHQTFCARTTCSVGPDPRRSRR